MRARAALCGPRLLAHQPKFFLVRAGVVLVILLLSYAWCRWGAGEWGFSPLIEMGKCSLLVYWVHIEFVYGGLSILPKRSVGNRNGDARASHNFCCDDFAGRGAQPVSRAEGGNYGVFSAWRARVVPPIGVDLPSVENPICGPEL